MRKCWRAIRKITNLTIRNQAKLDECLEAIADTEHQTITGIQKTADFFFYARIAEHSCDKFTRTIWLITTAETAWKHNNLRLLNTLDDSCDRFFNSSRRKVAYYQRLCFGASSFPSSSRIIFAISTWEYWDKYLWSYNMLLAIYTTASFIRNPGSIFFAGFFGR